MAYIHAESFENNNVTSGKYFTTVAGTPVIGTTNVRTGSKALQISSLVSATAKHTLFQWQTSNTSGPFYFQFALYVVTAPSAENRIFMMNDAANLTTPMIYMTLDNSRVLRMYDEDSVINSSSALTANTWYVIRVQFDRTASAGSHIVKANLNETEFASRTNGSISAGVQSYSVGGNLASEAQTTGEWWIDDVILANMPFPSSKVLDVRPSAAGDSNQWLNTSAGAGASTNYTLVDEDNSNDATDMVQSVTANDVDFYNVTDSGLSANDNIDCVMVGGRFRNNTADATTSFRFRVEKTGSGTVLESSSIIPNSTTWVTNATAVPRKFPIITQFDPDGALWTQSTLDSMQIGVKLIAAGTNRVQVSQVFARIIYRPGSAPTGTRANVTGSITQIKSSTNNSSQSVTIPADATFLLVLASYFYPTGFAGMTLNGSALTKEIEQNNASYQSVAAWWIKNPSTGTQTFAWDGSGTSAFTEGCIFFLIPMKDVDVSGTPTSGSAVGVGSAIPVTTAFNTTINDLVLCIGCGVTSGVDAGYGYGQVEIADSGTVYNTDFGAVGSKFGETTTTTVQVSGADAFTAVLGVSVKGTVSGGSPALSLLTLLGVG